MTNPVEPPKSLKALKTGPLKNRLNKAIQMSEDAKKMHKENRLEKYSFATLFKGKWGVHADSDDEDDNRERKEVAQTVQKGPRKSIELKKVKAKSPIVQVPEPVHRKKKRTKTTPKIIRPDIFSEDDDDDETDIPSFRHKPKNLNGQGKVKTRNQMESSSSNDEREDISRLAKDSKSDKEEEDDEDRLAEALNYELPSVYPVWTDKKKGVPLPKKIKPDPDKDVKPLITEIKMDIDSIKPEEHDPREKNHLRPSLPSDVLIALAVRNLDPSNQLGASFTDIIAFLSLHFPYFNRRIEECRDMVKKAYDMDEDDETGRENFRIKASLVERLAGRIKSYVAKHRVAVRASMLVPDFLDTMVERFADLGQNNPAAKVQHPLLLKHILLFSSSPTILICCC